MSTLVEELKKVDVDKQQTKELGKAIKEFITRPNVYDTLKKSSLKWNHCQNE